MIALADHLQLACEIVPVIDLFGKGDQRTAEYAARNPNMKMPMLDDDGFVLWESNAILFYLASLQARMRIAGPQGDPAPGGRAALARMGERALGRRISGYGRVRDIVRNWCSGWGRPDPAFVARGEQNFRRFAAVLNDALNGRRNGWPARRSRSPTSRSPAWSRPRNACSFRWRTIPAIGHWA